MESVGIIAGSGQFPALVARGARQSGMRVAICGLHGNADPALAELADEFVMLHLGQLGKLIAFFKAHGVAKVCMAGAVSKPKALDIKPDFRAARLIFKLGSGKGDDAILRAVAGELHSEGIAVVRPDSLAPGLFSADGVLTRQTPDAALWADIRFGWEKAKAVGALDIGQCVVVRSGIVVAVEGIDGTDATLERGGRLGGGGCTLVKVVKPGQDARLDMPSLGASTLALLAEHRYACLAFEATGTLFFDRQQALDIAEKHGIAVVAVPEDAAAFFLRNLERAG